MRPLIWFSAAVAVLTFAGPASGARAQTSVSVLGLTSLEGDDEFARNFTGALRHAASQVDGWTVSDRDVALSQMELTHDCSSSDAACMVTIAETLSSASVIYGTIQRAPIGTRYEFQVTLFLFDAGTGAIEERVTDTVPSSDTDIDALRDPARRMIRALSASSSPGTIRVTGTPGLSVRIDGTDVGRTDAGGTYVSDPVPPGEHTVTLGDEQITVAVAGDEALAAFALVEAGGEGGGGSVLPFVGIGLMAVGAAALVVSFWSMGELEALNNNPEYEAYRRNVGAARPGATTVCEASYFNAPGIDLGSVGERTCSQGATLEILQYVMLAAGVVALGAGTALLIVGLGENSSSEGESAGLNLRLTPTVGLDRAGLGLSLDF